MRLMRTVITFHNEDEWLGSPSNIARMIPALVSQTDCIQLDTYSSREIGNLLLVSSPALGVQSSSYRGTLTSTFF